MKQEDENNILRIPCIAFKVPHSGRTENQTNSGKNQA
jgi:hypothetical protein